MQTFSENIDSPLSSPRTPHSPLTSNAHTEVKYQISSPKSEATTDTGRDKGHKPTKATTIEVDPSKTLEISDTGTLKKKGRLAAVKRISSPLAKMRRKSVSGKAEKKEERDRLKEKLGVFKRQTTMPEIPIDRSKISASPIAQELVALDPLPSYEPVNTALKLMVSLSSNKECTATLISYICLPKCEAK